METKSRFYDLQKKKQPVLDVSNTPKNKQEIVTFTNKFGHKKITAILNWKNGFLTSEEGIPAVQMEDFHTEYWENGVISNTRLDGNGNMMPAVISDYGTHLEYWINGKRIK